MSRDSFGSFTSPIKPLTESSHRDSFGSFQEYNVEPIQASDDGLHEPNLDVVNEEISNELPQESTKMETEISNFTDVNVFYQITASDPVLDACKKCFTYEELVGMNSRALMSVDEALKSGKDALEILISNQSWFAVTQYTRNALIACSTDDIDQIMKIWSIRLLALYQLNQYDALEYEFTKLGDLNRKSLYYEYYKNSKITGPMVTFEISLLYCLVPLLKQQYSQTVERLYGLLYSLKHKDKSCQILIHIANILLKMEEYFLGQQVFECVSESLTDDNLEKLELDSIRGRIYLQLGDLESASNLFDDVYSRTKDHENSRFLYINQALLSVSKGDWESSISYFNKILSLDPNDWIIYHNISVLELYKGQVSEALVGLDALLVKNPKEMARSPEAIFNLCTVYDLLDQPLERKKKVLSNVISPFAGDDFQVESLKL